MTVNFYSHALENNSQSYPGPTKMPARRKYIKSLKNCQHFDRLGSFCVL